MCRERGLVVGATRRDSSALFRAGWGLLMCSNPDPHTPTHMLTPVHTHRLTLGYPSGTCCGTKEPWDVPSSHSLISHLHPATPLSTLYLLCILTASPTHDMYSVSLAFSPGEPW